MYVMANVFMSLRLKSTNCPPLFSKRADLAGRGGGSTSWNCTDSSAWAENPSKEECSRRGTVVT